MTEIFTASAQWASRPADERYTSLIDMQAMMYSLRDASRAVVVGSKRIHAQPSCDDPMNVMQVTGPNGHAYEPSNWAFGQLASLAGAPAGYLRKLPAAMAADCINWGMKERPVEEVGVLLRRGGDVGRGHELVAATGPQYGRVWNADIVDTLVHRFGDGVTGDWRVPGEFGRAVKVSKDNTTLYAGDRDMFVFLADEINRVEMLDRREGKPGSLARGFYVSNSEVGASKLVIAMFLFDFVCCNRIIWGARDFREISIRHSSGAPDRWLDEAMPVIQRMASGSAEPVSKMIAAARASRLDDAQEWLSKRYSVSMATSLMNTHLAEEARPIESLWDVSTALTAKARGIQYQDERVAMERDAGRVLDLAL